MLTALRAWVVRAACGLLVLSRIAPAALFAERPAARTRSDAPRHASQPALASYGPQAATTAAPVTFSRDIAPIVFDHCTSCHRPGEAAPFSLSNYDEVRRHAQQVTLMTRSRYMPPWKPEPGYGEFQGARRLTDEQIGLIEQWVKQGALEGDPRDLPPAPTWTTGWQLGSPDLVVTMPEPYLLEGGGRDVFRTFVVPVPLSSARYVKGMEFRAGATRAIHHENTKLDRTGSSRRQDEEDARPGFSGSAGPNARFPGGYFQGRTPGTVPRMLPDGMSWRLEPGSDLVFELHMMPTGKPEAIQVSVGLFFTDESPTRVPYTLRLGNQSIDIPAGEREYVSTDSYVLPVDVDVLEVYPHAHYLAKEIRGIARLPDGTTRWLLFIRSWDFRWQDNYRLVEPLRLPKGTTLEMRYTYDNSTENPRNPTTPPRRVTFGPESSAEMGDLWIQVLPAGGIAALERDFMPKMLREDISGREKVLEVNPGDAHVRTELAARYVDAGRIDDAVAQLHAAIKLQPGSALAHHDLGAAMLRQKRLDEAAVHFRDAGRLMPKLYEAFNNLGVVLFLQGKVDQAIAAYNQALGVRPDAADARYNLGKAFAASGRPDDAIVEYRRALQSRPEDGETHYAIAGTLASHGALEEGIRHYREALRLRPALVGALVDLAWILATTSRPDIRAAGEAVGLAQRAADLTAYEDPTVLDTLGVAYAAAGQLGQAITAARAALALATNQGTTALAAEIRKRLDSYQPVR